MLKNIKKLCVDHDISLSELERRSGINPGSIYRWDENTPSVDKVKKVADYLGVTVDELLEPDEQEGG